jgi:putative ABC transport system permease protein
MPSLVSTLLNQAYSTPGRPVHTFLQVTLQVWQPMHYAPLIVYVLTIEKIKSIATLKLIGAPNTVIVRLILEQSLALTLASFAGAWLLRNVIAPGFPRTLSFAASETAITFAVMLAGGVLASGMAIWHALRTSPQLALGG